MHSPVENCQDQGDSALRILDGVENFLDFLMIFCPPEIVFLFFLLFAAWFGSFVLNCRTMKSCKNSFEISGTASKCFKLAAL